MSDNQSSMQDQGKEAIAPAFDHDRQNQAKEYARIRRLLLLVDIAVAFGYMLVWLVTGIADPRQVMEGLEADGSVVLLDMKMKSINGLDVLRTIREQYPRLPVILVTGYREEMSPAIEAAFKIGAYTCLCKPFEIENLLEVLSQVRRSELGRVLGRH